MWVWINQRSDVVVWSYANAHTHGLSDRRGWQDGAVDCCLRSIGYDYWEKYWANTNTTQYRWQVLANSQYPNTGIVQTLLTVY